LRRMISRMELIITSDYKAEQKSLNLSGKKELYANKLNSDNDDNDDNGNSTLRLSLVNTRRDYINSKSPTLKVEGNVSVNFDK